MGNFIKVNFNNLKIKTPHLEQPIIKRISYNNLKIINPNTKFENSKIITYINDVYLSASDTFEYILEIPPALLTSEAEKDSTFKLTVELQNSINKYYKEMKFEFHLPVAIRCSEFIICSDIQKVNDVKGG